MRLLVTGASGLIGSNLAAAAAHQSWSVLGTWRNTPVSLPGARTAPLDTADRRACVALAEEIEPDVVIHAAGESSLGRLERDPRLAERDRLGVEHTLAAARTVHARYVLVSCDLVFSGLRPSGECWEESDPTQPANALGRSLLARERLTQEFRGSWLITRPADVYGVNLSTPAGTKAAAARARHIWERSGPPLHWLARLRAGQPLAAPTGIRRSPTYAWDYAERVCELIAQECDGLYHTAGPTILGRLAHLRMLARAFGCEPRLVQEGSSADFLEACGEDERGVSCPLPANTALCDLRASFALGRPAVDPFTGHRLMRRQLEWLLGERPPSGSPPPVRETPAAPVAPVPAPAQEAGTHEESAAPLPMRSALG